MDTIDQKLRAILKGKIIEDEAKEFLNIDYTLVQQQCELRSQGIEPRGPAEFIPRLGQTITYVVAAIIFNERNEVLMIQESKSSCAGQWYVPAGRVEAHESFEEAIKREVIQESGLEFEATTLLLVESYHATWFRFVFAGRVTGGRLKTSSQADRESIQALYIPLNELGGSKFHLRSKDCLRLIKLGQEYHFSHGNWHSPQLTMSRPVPNILLRLFVAIRSRESPNYHVLLANSLIPHLPLAEINPAQNVFSTLRKFFSHLFGSALPQHKPVGLLAVEHQAVPDSSTAASSSAAVSADLCDGLCLSLLVMIKDHLEVTKVSPGFSWHRLDADCQQLLLTRLSSKAQSIPFLVL